MVCSTKYIFRFCMRITPKTMYKVGRRWHIVYVLGDAKRFNSSSSITAKPTQYQTNALLSNVPRRTVLSALTLPVMPQQTAAIRTRPKRTDVTLNNFGWPHRSTFWKSPCERWPTRPCKQSAMKERIIAAYTRAISPHPKPDTYFSSNAGMVDSPHIQPGMPMAMPADSHFRQAVLSK